MHSIFNHIPSLILLLFPTQAYNGEDYNGARIVSRACELRDAVQHGISFVFCIMLEILMLAVAWKILLILLFFLLLFSGAWDALTDGSSTGCIL